MAMIHRDGFWAVLYADRQRVKEMSIGIFECNFQTLLVALSCGIILDAECFNRHSVVLGTTNDGQWWDTKSWLEQSVQLICEMVKPCGFHPIKGFK